MNKIFLFAGLFSLSLLMGCLGGGSYSTGNVVAPRELVASAYPSSTTAAIKFPSPDANSLVAPGGAPKNKATVSAAASSDSASSTPTATPAPTPKPTATPHSNACSYPKPAITFPLFHLHWFYHGYSTVCRSNTGSYSNAPSFTNRLTNSNSSSIPPITI
ncbi:hypothetical protein HY995_02755 [Candidatus Micrarchaeota archaeon]|nr:hypothetical protein [Candidatus Micrarchaeota archaeon]